MANEIYDLARVQLLTAALDWTAIDLQLIAWSGTPDFKPTDTKLADIKARGGVELGTSMAIVWKGVSADGSAQTDDVVIPSVPIGPAVTWFTLGRSGSPHDNGQPILFIDDAVNLPFTPNGLDMVVTPDWLLSRGWFKP